MSRGLGGDFDERWARAPLQVPIGVRRSLPAEREAKAEAVGLVDAGHVRHFVENIPPLSEAAQAISEQGYAR